VTEYFVILTPGMGMPGMDTGFTGGHVFISRTAAQDFIKTSNLVGAKIERHPVDGEYVASGHVFAANRYLADADDHDFVGLFANFADAKRAAGEKSLVLELIPR
jgi:hypothetical protein